MSLIAEQWEMSEARGGEEQDGTDDEAKACLMI
jgi:hypothetical protein